MLLKGSAGKKLPLFLPCSTTSTAANKTGTWRYFRPIYQEKTAPCAAACPSSEDIPRAEMLAARGAYKEAWQSIVCENPFPAVCGRVCFHACEQACNRTQLDEPIAIRLLERSLADRAIAENWSPALQRARSKDKTAAIIGAGPAGLSAAYFLTGLGYGCEVFEAQPEPGGLLRWGIPAYRLPTDILAAEIDRIRGLGVNIHCNNAFSPADLPEFQNRYDAVVITCGYGRSIDMKIRGAEHAVDGLALLSRLGHQKPLPQKGTVAVIGGGNTAIDVARSLVRLGARPIIVYRRRREDMPAFEPEIARALEEGVQLRELVAPLSIAANNEPDSTEYTLALQKMKPASEKIGGRNRVLPVDGQTETLHVNHVVTAIGADVADDWTGAVSTATGQWQLSHCHLIEAPRPIIIGGDMTTPIKSVADAIASGKQAAMALDIYYAQGAAEISAEIASCRLGSGPAVSMAAYMQRRQRPASEKIEKHTPRITAVVDFDQINIDYFEPARRIEALFLSPADRNTSFSECEASLSLTEAKAEAERCFNCGTCCACDNCRLFCPESAVLVDKAVRSIDLDYCKGCGVCVAECPRNAMAMEE